MLAKVGRLLELKPEHAAGRQLAARFCERLCQVARQRLAECRYQEVVKVLDRIPESLRSDAVREIRDKAGELALVAWDLQNAPMVDSSLVKLALHFRKQAPHDRQMAPVCFQVLDRAKDIAADPWQAAVPWKTIAVPSPLGCPVVWETVPKRIGLARLSVRPHFGKTRARSRWPWG